MGSFFLNPGLVIPGAALIASPIIIHLINRLRFRRVRFAAMEFLLQSQQRNRRRILIEQLILLLLRILIVLAIMFLIARFFLSASQLSLLQGKAASHHVILIDDSGSMRERAGEESVFGRAKVVVRRLVAKGAQEPGTQRVTILLLSKPDKALFREAEVDDNLVKRVETSLQNVDCTRRRLDLVDGIKAAGKTLLDDQESRTAIKMLHVISDFRDEDWKTAQSSLVSTVESLTKAKVSVNLIRTIKQGGANVAVTKLSGDVYTAAVGVEMQVTIGLTNFGRQPKENIAVRLWADGKRLPLAVVFDKLPPGREVQRSADVLFETAGVHKLRAELVPVDSLDSDNTRFLAVEKLPEAHKVLLIDGDPAAKDALYVADALAAEKNIAGIQVETHGPDWLRRNPLDAFQCIYMINVPQVDADAMRPLTQYVRDGGGLVCPRFEKLVGDLSGAYSRRI
ncbi:MAG: BatA domain-containing protein, partial [Planctomycetaceae bacterium]